MEIIPASVIERISYNPATGIFIWISDHKYNPALNGSMAGCESTGYLTIKINGFNFKAHRIAWFIMTGDQPHEIDHINGDALDNRFLNLRNVTHYENTKNHGRIINGSGLPCGVRNTSSGKYQARITADKKVIHLGTFEDIQSAKSAYENAKLKYFKEYSRGYYGNN